MQGLFRSGLFARLTGAGTRVGERAARECAWWFYTDRIKTPAQPVHARERYAALARALDATPRRQDLDVRETERESARTLLRDAGWSGDLLVTVCPGARWETKVYPPEHFAAVLDEIASRGIKHPVLVGGDDLAEACDRIAESCTQASPISLAGRTGLRDLTALLDLADVMITCDSGPMHIAAAQGTPTVAVFGPTDPIRTGPWGQLDGVVTGECELMPCLKRRCPGMGHICMRELPPARIAEKALALTVQTPDNIGADG
jgi:heptosyltransferase I